MTNQEYSQKMQKVVQGIEMICNALNILEDEIDISVFEKSKFILKTEYEYLPNFEAIQNEINGIKSINNEIFYSVEDIAKILNKSPRQIRRYCEKITDLEKDKFYKRKGKKILISEKFINSLI